MARSALVALLLATALLAGCSASDEGSDEASGSGSASAYIKDAPADDFREVHVLVTEVSVHRSSAGVGSNGTSTTITQSTGTSTTVGNSTVTASATASATGTGAPTSAGAESGWIVLFSDASGVDVDLLNTTGAKAAFLGEADLGAGHYQQVRATVKSAWGITTEGENVTITVSSGTLRSVRSFEVEEDRETRITIDIDLEKSLHETGNGQWRMTPVVGKTTATVVDDGSSGEESAQPGDVESVPESA
jgi:hypothetical protein